jgi:hypothetical protein
MLAVVVSFPLAAFWIIVTLLGLTPCAVKVIALRLALLIVTG